MMAALNEEDYAWKCVAGDLPSKEFENCCAEIMYRQGI
jgi:hypothetical protein